MYLEHYWLFTLSFDDFIVSYFVSGNGIENISIVIYNMSKRTNPSIYALATIILVVVLVVVVLGTIIPRVFPKATDKLLKSKVVKVILAGCLLISVRLVNFSWNRKKDFKSV